MAGSPGGKRQAGPRHHADALARAESNARARRRVRTSRAYQRAMGDVRIVARVLDHAGAGDQSSPRRKLREREGDALARRQARSPPGSGGGAPVTSASKAARVAAVAQAPVVQPRRKRALLRRVVCMRPSLPQVAAARDTGATIR